MDQSVVVTCLHSSKLFQVKIHNLVEAMETLTNVEAPAEDYHPPCKPVSEEAAAPGAACGGEKWVSQTDGTPFSRRKYVSQSAVIGSSKHQKDFVTEMTALQMRQATAFFQVATAAYDKREEGGGPRGAGGGGRTCLNSHPTPSPPARRSRREWRGGGDARRAGVYGRIGGAGKGRD